MVPKQWLAVIILASLSGAGRLYSVVDSVLDAVLHPSDPPEVHPFAEERGEPMATEEATQYSGVYENTMAIELFMRGTQLFFRSSALELPVTKTREHFFYAERPGELAGYLSCSYPSVAGGRSTCTRTWWLIGDVEGILGVG
jgi:hypothetical protein